MFFQLINGWRIGEAFDAPRKPDPHTLENGDFVTYEWAGEASNARETYVAELEKALRQAEAKIAALEAADFLEVL